MKGIMRLGALLAILLAGTVAAEADGSAAWVGLVVSYEDFPDLAEGRMTIVTVHPEGPAAKAGLRVGDVISRVNETAFRFRDWTATVAQGGPFVWAKPGDALRMTVLRGGKTEIVEVVAIAPPPLIVGERRKFQQSLVERRGPEVFAALARRGVMVRIQREQGGGPVAATAEGLMPEELAALSSYFNTTRLRVLFTQLEPGKLAKVQLGLEADTGEPKIEVIP